MNESKQFNKLSLTKNKLHLHFISPRGGSIWEITNDLATFFENEFIVTKEWLGEIPQKREILFCHFLKPELFLSPDIFDSFEVKILIQPIDGTSIKKDIVDMLNCFDLIFTPGKAGKDIMEKNGIKVPITILPNYYKKDIFEKKIYTEVEKYIPKGKVIFYHESSFHPRKGVNLLYEGFIRAFGDTPHADKVVLIVKDLPYMQQTFERNEEIKKQAIKLQKCYKKPPLILKFSSFLHEDDLKTLWNLTDIYVSLAKIEGFGIPMLRSFLMNKPIIALNNENSGYIDYLSSSNSYLIECVQSTAKDEFMWLYERDTLWGFPNMQDVIETFLTAYTNFVNKDCKQLKSDFSCEWQEYFEIYEFEHIARDYISMIKEAYRTEKNKICNEE